MDIFLPGNLKFLRKQKGLTLEAMAERVAIKKNTLNNYELGVTEPGLSTLILLSHFFGFSIDELARVDLSGGDETGKPGVFAPSLLQNNSLVPILDPKKIGVPTSLPTSAMSFPAYLFSPGVMVGFQAEGEAMNPTIKPGDYLIARPVEPLEVRAGQVYLVSFGQGETELVVRRAYYYHESGVVVLTADNSDYSELTVPVTGDVRLYHVEGCVTTQLLKPDPLRAQLERIENRLEGLGE